MIIVCYDGSEDAQAAADHVTRAFRGKPATVLTVWEPYAEVLASSELGLGSGFGVGYDRDTAGLDAELLEGTQCHPRRSLSTVRAGFSHETERR
jgi:hypothetical protein